MLLNKKLYLVLFFGFIMIIILLFSVIAIMTPKSNAWAMEITQIEDLLKLGFDGTNVTIGIIDTGLDIHHQDFDTSSFIAWIDTVNNNSNYYDDEGYGTHIMGILAAKGSLQGIYSGINLHGIAINSKYVITKSIPQDQYLFGGTDDNTIALGIQFCIDNEVDIILLSLGSGIDDVVIFDENSQTVSQINNAISKGIFVVVPAGNDGQRDDGDVNFIANLENVISIGAISKGNSILSFSSKGHQYPHTINPNKKPELVSPGDQITSTRRNGAYGDISGTSQAAAYVTGVIALLLDAYPEFKHDGDKNENVSTIQLFKEIFAKTARKIGNLMNINEEFSHDDLYGYGLIQAYDAYLELSKY